MPARDIYHDNVRSALEKDGWLITHDPLRLSWGPKDMYVDLGAEQLVAAEREGVKIAVEIKSFVGPSEIEDLKNALGQYVLYRNVIRETEPGRDLYLAIRQATFVELFEEPLGLLLVTSERIRLIVFDPHKEVVVQWIR
ncbi:MAG: element excision factor XisH family protein [Anaerolineae bacterium]